LILKLNKAAGTGAQSVTHLGHSCSRICPSWTGKWNRSFYKDNHNLLHRHCDLNLVFLSFEETNMSHWNISQTHDPPPEDKAIDVVVMLPQ
jgi:hypothetical protein